MKSILQTSALFSVALPFVSANNDETFLCDFIASTNVGSISRYDSWNCSEVASKCSWSGITCSSDSIVTSIALNEVGISGFVPNSIVDVSGLTLLSLWSNSLTGTIPETLGQMSELAYLDLGSNSLTGTLPRSFGNAPELGDLYLDDNSITGFVPNLWGQMDKLTLLFLDNNQLMTSNYPPELCTLPTFHLSSSEDHQCGPSNVCSPGFESARQAGCTQVAYAKSYPPGKRLCSMWGEGLVMLKDRFAHLALYKQLLVSGFSADVFNTRRKGFYIGLKWSETSNAWLWSDGSQLGSFAPWKQGYGGTPTRRKFCVILLADATWRNVKCHQEQISICYNEVSESSSYRLIESKHPYANNLRDRQFVGFPLQTTSGICGEFDIADTYFKDKLRIFPMVGTREMGVLKRYENSWDPFEVTADYVKLFFKTDEQDTKYGYQLRLWPCDPAQARSGEEVSTDVSEKDKPSVILRSPLLRKARFGAAAKFD